MRRLMIAALVAVPVVAGCGGGGSSQQVVTVTASPPAGTSAGSAAPSSPAGTARPAIVAVTSAGALVVLDSSTGTAVRTLVPGGVLGDEVSVSPGGSTVYFAAGQAACDRQIESVSISGGTPTAIAPGILPAVSPDGTRLAFAQEPVLTPDCTPGQSSLTASFRLVIRTIATGAQRVLPMPPQAQQSGLPVPISHLSWAFDSSRLAVSVSSVQDNEGWGVYIVDTAAARYYLPPDAGVSSVPVTGQPDTQRSYLREGVFWHEQDLFVSRACCGGVPIRNTSRLMWQVTTGGTLEHQVAIGYPNLDHVSLAVSRDTHWLLYLAGHDLYVSDDGARPVLLASGFIAAAWA